MPVTIHRVKPLSKYQKWYRSNKTRVAKQRRERYQSDPAYRKKNLNSCKEWRKKNQPWKSRMKVERTYLLIGEFAEQVGCSPETIRNLEAKKLLPRVTNGVARRKYHPANVELVQSLVEFRKEQHYTEPGYDKQMKALVFNIKKSWRKAV